VAGHQNCASSVDHSNAGHFSVQYAWLHGEKASRCLKSFFNAGNI